MLVGEAVHVEEQGAYGKFCFPLSFVVNLKVKSLSCVQLFATPWTIAYQTPPFMGFSRQDTGVGCHVFLQEIFLTQGLNLEDNGTPLQYSRMENPMDGRAW